MAKLTIARKGPDDTYLVLAQLSETHLPDGDIENVAAKLVYHFAHLLDLPLLELTAFRWDDGEETIDCEAVPHSSFVYFT